MAERFALTADQGLAAEDLAVTAEDLAVTAEDLAVTAEDLALTAECFALTEDDLVHTLDLDPGPTRHSIPGKEFTGQGHEKIGQGQGQLQTALQVM